MQSRVWKPNPCMWQVHGSELQTPPCQCYLQRKQLPPTMNAFWWPSLGTRWFYPRSAHPQGPWGWAASYQSSVRVKWPFRAAIDLCSLGSSIKAILILCTMQINTNRHELVRYKIKNHTGLVMIEMENDPPNCHCWW